MLHIIKLIKKRPLNELYIFSYLIIYWFFIWSSIGVEHKSILNFGKNLTEIINFFRINVALILSLFSSFFLIYVIFKKYKKLFKYIIFILFIFFFNSLD